MRLKFWHFVINAIFCADILYQKGINNNKTFNRIWAEGTRFLNLQQKIQLVKKHYFEG